MKKLLSIIATIAILGTATLGLIGCEYHTDNSDEWKTKFDISNPVVDNAGADVASANTQGWYSTMQEDFDGEKLNELWSPSPHGLRYNGHWCDDMVSLSNGTAIIKAVKKTDHKCSSAICPSDGYFTSGIETQKKVEGKTVSLFEQAFGYFETKVKFPNSGGMWSAFWLQTKSMGKIGNQGMDGSEIDIYESSFINNRTKVGHCIHFDGYGKHHKGGQSVREAGSDLYEGYHTFALKWTPNEYVFYVDGVANWATDFGGICRVPAYIRLTNEIRPNEVGPYGQKVGEFTGDDFKIDYVKVYQNVNYLNEIKSPADFS
ncbi:MAG: family 16 glycosylhydrolase [Clostridia bacterium]